MWVIAIVFEHEADTASVGLDTGGVDSFVDGGDFFFTPSESGVGEEFAFDEVGVAGQEHPEEGAIEDDVDHLLAEEDEHDCD